MGKKPQIKTEENGDGDALEDVSASSKGGKKGKKSRKKDFDEDDIARELEELSLEVNGELPANRQIPQDKQPEEDKEKSEKDSKKGSDDSDSDGGIQPTVGGCFAALMEDMDDDGDDAKETPSKQNEKEEEEEPVKPEKSKKEKTKKKSKRKGKDDDEDDLEELLAQIESEYRGEKKEEKKADAPKEEEKDLTQQHEEKEQRETKNGKGAEDATLKKNENVDEEKMDEPQKKKDGKDAKQVSQKKDANEKSSEVAQKKKTETVESPKLEEKVEEGGKKKKKTKTKEPQKKEEDEEPKARKGKPTKKMIEAMKQLLAKQKDDDERRRREAEEKANLEDERLRELEEQQRIEEERKEAQRQLRKDKLKRLKDEGKYMTPKQKMEKKRAQAMLAYLKAQGVEIPEAGSRPPPSMKKKKKQAAAAAAAAAEMADEEEPEPEEAAEQEQEPESEEAAVPEEEEEDDVVDAWDQLSESEEELEATDKESSAAKDESKLKVESAKAGVKEDKGSESEVEVEEHQTEAEKRRERAVQRMKQRKAENEKNKSLNRLRAPVVCVLGHVDHGKTKILDKLRRTNVQEGEVGGITQQIGATNVPFDAIKSQTRMVKDFDPDLITLPGLLIIDTPGHESFSNLRSRGSSLCDIAILVVDMTQGLEPQTIESINLLKTRKTPFVVALNKVDRVFEWESNPNKDIREVIKLQNDPCKNDFDRRTSEVIQALNMQGLNAALFWDNPDARSYVSLVPTSAISGDGMGNLMSLITVMCQKRLAARLMFSDELQCTVLEVKTIQGHGTTIDVILINGQLREGDTIVLAGTECPIVTQIRSLLIPKPMREIRVKGQYDELKVVQAALGVKLAARELEKAIAGLNLQVASNDDEVDILREEVDREFKAAMRSMKVKDKGVYVQASTLGALEALLEFFKTNKVPYAGIRVGPVVKRDVMKAAAMLEHDPMYAVILAFDVKVERDAQELADKEGIKIFSEETIYHLGDRYVDYIKEYKKKKQDEFRHVSVFPCKLKIIPDAIFNKRDPIVLGVTVDVGILRTGTPLCVPSKEFVDIGVVTSLEFDHKAVDIAKKGVSVCMKVEPLPGHTPKLFGRHFDAEDLLVSKISRDSIDACKQYFRDDLGQPEWKLMAELKKEFNIL